jgi:hypothetical protein
MPEMNVPKLAMNQAAKLMWARPPIEPERYAIEEGAPATDSKPVLIEQQLRTTVPHRQQSALPHSFPPKPDRTETMSLKTETLGLKIKIEPLTLAMNERTLETNGPKVVRREHLKVRTLRVIARRLQRTVSATPMIGSGQVMIAEQQRQTVLRRKRIGETPPE